MDEATAAAARDLDVRTTEAVINKDPEFAQLLLLILKREDHPMLITK